MWNLESATVKITILVSWSAPASKAAANASSQNSRVFTASFQP